MLSYFKYIAIVSFFLVTATAFFVGVYFKAFVADSLIKEPASRQGAQIAKYFEDNLWCKYSKIINKLSDVPAEKWDDNRGFSKFSKLSKTILNSIPALKISILNNKREEILTTHNLEMVFFDEVGDNPFGFEQAVSGLPVSRVVPSMGYYKDNTLYKGAYVQGFYPVMGRNCSLSGVPDIVLEVYYDATNAWNRLFFFQLIVSGGIVLIFIALYVVLFLTSKKAERIINKQHEEKLGLERAKSVAEARDQQKSMFLANVSHELRTPLNAIIGFSEIIKDEALGSVGHPQYKEYVNDINSSGVHLLSLINDILDYSKAEARKLEVESVEIDLSKISISCMRLVEPRAKEAKVKLVENIPESHVTLSADPKRMKQVILNLLSNAVKFTQEEGEVSLTIREDALEGMVSLIVADNGIGIAPKDISKALSPFGQIDSSISRRYEGTGLGLPLTKKLTELMGGKFDLKSEVGLGTTITLIFPLVKEKTEKEKQEF